MDLPHGAWVVVADGERRLLLENRGDPDLIDLRVREHAERPTEPNAVQGSDEPGRFPVHGGRRETVQEADWRRLDKARFAAELADELNAAAAADGLPPWVLVADPRSLGEIRQRLAPPARERMLRDLPADHTHDAVPQIEALIKRI